MINKDKKEVVRQKEEEDHKILLLISAKARKDRKLV